MKSSPLYISDFTIDRTALIDSLPIPYMAYEATEPYRIIDENAAHEAVAMTKRDEIIGQAFLDVFPDTSEEFKKTGKSAPIESIKKIVRSGQPDSLGEFKYDVRNKNGEYVMKYWRSTQYPIFDTTHKTVVAVYQLTEDITDKKLTERQLALTKYQLDQTLANGLIGTWVWDIKNARVYGGPNLANIFGIDSEAAAQGLPIEEFIKGIHPEDRKRLQTEISQTVEKRSNFKAEYRTVDRQGHTRWVIARGRVETDEAGELDRFPGVVVDITDRKEVEQALSESETRLRFMADSMPQLVWITRPDGYHEYYNYRWYEYTGTKEGTTDGEGWNTLFHADDQPKAWKKWRHSLRTGEPYEIEYRLYHAPTREYRWVIGRALPLRDESGTITKWYGTCTDIDEQKRGAQLQAFMAEASKELGKSLDYLKTLKRVGALCVPEIADWCSVDFYDPANDSYEQVMVAHADPDKVSYAIEHRQRNPPSSDGTTGVSAVIRTGKSEIYPVINDAMLEQYITDADQLKFMKSLNLHSIIIAPIFIHNKPSAAISFVSTDSGRYYNDGDLLMAEELAARISLAVTNSKLYDDSIHEIEKRKQLARELTLEKQKPESRVLERTQQLQLTNQGLRDEIIKRREVEGELKLNSTNLQRSNQELQDFAYVASHDLQEPLRKIQAFSNLLESEYAERLGDGKDYVERMRSAASRMSTLINDLLAFSRVTTKANPVVEVDLNTVLEGVLSDLESRIQDTRGTVKIVQLPVIMADPTHMRQLFQNLISNALKFHQPDMAPEVAIDYREYDDGEGSRMHEITVGDNGIGFDQKYTDRIFAVFQRLHDRDQYGGTGIGLAVCRKIVERYNGTITATSQKNHGATFIIHLPKAKESV